VEARGDLGTRAIAKTRRAILAFSDVSLAERVAERLPDTFHVVHSSPSEGRDALWEGRMAGTVVFAHIRHAEMIFGSALTPVPGAESAALSACPPIVFVTGDSAPGEYFHLIARYGIARFLHPRFLNDARMLASLLEGVFEGTRRHDLSHYCESDEPICREAVRDAAARLDAIDRICEAAARRFGADYQVTEHRLAVEELLNNALFHAFHDAHEEPREASSRPRPLGENEEVAVEYLADERLFAFSVTDSGGRLTGDIVRREINRQFSGEGLLQAHGRGVFLTFSFANAFILNSIPGRLSQVVVAFYRRLHSDCKMFQINASPMTL